MNPTSSRRDILKVAALTAAAVPFAGVAAMGQNNRELLQPPLPISPGKDPWKGLKIGVASYTFHKLPLEACIDAIKRIDLHYVSIKDSHLKIHSSHAFGVVCAPPRKIAKKPASHSSVSQPKL